MGSSLAENVTSRSAQPVPVEASPPSIIRPLSTGRLTPFSEGSARFHHRNQAWGSEPAFPEADMYTRMSSPTCDTPWSTRSAGLLPRVSGHGTRQGCMAAHAFLTQGEQIYSVATANRNEQQKGGQRPASPSRDPCSRVQRLSLSDEMTPVFASF